MYRTILEEITERKLSTPEWKYVDAEEVLEAVKVIRPKWRWMVRVCGQMPQGKCVMFPVPEDEEIYRWAELLRLSVNCAGMAHKYSIRCAKNERYVVVLKGEAWKDYYQRLENEPTQN